MLNNGYAKTKMIAQKEKALMLKSNRENPNRTKLTNLRVEYAKKAYGDILDVGGGVGRFLPFLNGNVTICDIIHEDIFSLDHDKKIILDADRPLPFKNDSFDVVWASGICHFLNLERFVTEAKRITKNGGKILIMIPNMKSLWNIPKKALGMRIWQDQKNVKKDYSYQDLLALGAKVDGEISFLPFDGLFRKFLFLSHTLSAEIDVIKPDSIATATEPCCGNESFDQVFAKLTCPYCLPGKGSLNTSVSGENGYLSCDNCGRRFPFVNDTFVFDSGDQYLHDNKSTD